ncbi:hypothetical protein [Actinoplanes sp. NPDC026670]|uniref:hypothetical protein n=1 Tax=Actinoplanes sp. NPDC026670 TaxID=3154700 RepID=UPI0033C9F083
MTGVAAIAVSAMAASVLYPAAEQMSRVLIVTVAAGVVAAKVTRIADAAVLTIAAASAFVIDPGGADAAGAPALLPYTPVFLMSLMLGRGYRYLSSENTLREPARRRDADSEGGSSLLVWPDEPTKP